MESHDERHMPLRSYSNGSVATTWMISYTAVRARNEAAANLLLLWAHLDNKSLWHGLLAAASQKSGIAALRTSTWLKEIALSEIEFIKAIQILRNYSLVEEMEDQTGYATHPVVHQWALHIQDDDQRAALSCVAIITVGLAVPMSDTKKYWETQMRLLPHAEQCEKIIKKVTKDRFEKQRLYGQEDEERTEEKRTLLLAVHSLGNLYRDRGKQAKAENMYVQALEGREKTLGAEDTSTLQTVNNLGNLYREQGNLEKAETMHMRALQEYNKALGEEDASTLQTVNNLGALYRDQGKLDKAERMYVQALEGREKTLGAEDTSTLQTVNSLGLLYADQGKLDKAEIMYMRALEGYKNKLGVEHTSTLNILNNLGLLYVDQGKLVEAEKVFVQALEGYEKALGAEHMSTLNTVGNLGLLYADQGKLDKAEDMYIRALKGKETALGRDHTSTLGIVNNFGVLYRRQGKLDKAKEMYHWALEGYKKSLGPDHTLTLQTADNLDAVDHWGRSITVTFGNQNTGFQAGIINGGVSGICFRGK